MKYKASLVVAVYKQVDFLELVFKSIEQQTFRNFELIIAEDDCSPDVKAFIDKKRECCSLDIKHITQADKGFRKNRLLNKAIAAAEGEYLVFIDGDCILHKDFLKEHMQHAKPEICLFGRRVMLDADTSEKLIESKDFNLLSIFKLLFTKTKHIECAIHLPFSFSLRKSGVRGCNFSVLKEKMIQINGFDEDFETPFFGEDTDVQRRLKLINVKLKCSKFQTIQYHLHHGSTSRRDVWKISEDLYLKKVSEGKSFCDNGCIKK
jgi:glycosyltransferase involved in cell wall biosynthesis